MWTYVTMSMREMTMSLFLITLFISKDTGVSSQILIPVIFNSAEHLKSSNATFPMAMVVKKSFEKIPPMLGISEEVNFVYKDLNSTFCDLGSFLSFVEGIAPCELVVLLMEDCQCEKMLLPYLNMLRIKYVSSCEQPFFTANGTTAIIQRVSKEKQLYILVPTDAYGEEFYEDLSFQLHRKKLKLHRTLWLGANADNDTQLQNELKNVAQAIDNNKKSGAVFVLGFLNPNDFRIKNLFTVARTILGKQFGEILWIFPVVHLDFGDTFYFQKDSQVLAFQEGIPGTVSCNHESNNCALRLVLEKTFYFLQSCWKIFELREMEYSRMTSVQKLDKAGYNFSVKNQECKVRKHSCSIDVLQLISDHLVGEMNWRRVATWNRDTLQPCSSAEEKQKTLVFGSKTETVFRVPIIEYSPFVEKHEFRKYYADCPLNSLLCYGQKRNAEDNNTVVDYDDKYCCSGWTIDVLNYLTISLFYEFELYFQADALFGVRDNNTGAWNGVIQDILSGKGDLAVDLGINPERCIALDCSLGYFYDGFNAIVKLGAPKMDSYEKDSFHGLVGNFQIFLSPFHIDLLITVLMIFNVFLFLIWATDKICLSYRNKRLCMKKEKFTLLESTSYVWATAFGRDVGDSKKPVTLSARYLSSWLAFLALVFVNVYVARLMAEIVKQDPIKPFTSLREPEILNKNLKVGVVKGSSMEAYFHNTRDPVLKKSYENIEENLLPTLEAGVKAVKNGNLDGFIADTISLDVILNQDPNCSLSLMGKDFATIAVGFMFRKDWPWGDEFKLQELNMIENKKTTDLMKMSRTWPLCEASSHEHAQLKVSDMSGVFLILMFAIAYCCFSLVLENISSLLLDRYRNSNVDWSVPHSRRTNAVEFTSSSFNTTAM